MKIQVLLKSDKNDGYFTRRPTYIFDHILIISCKNAKCFRLDSPENRTVYEIVWKNTVKPDRQQITEYRMRISRGVPKATNTLLEYVILISFIQQQLLYKHALMLRNTYIACLFCL